MNKLIKETPGYRLTIIIIYPSGVRQRQWGEWGERQQAGPHRTRPRLVGTGELIVVHCSPTLITLFRPWAIRGNYLTSIQIDFFKNDVSVKNMSLLVYLNLSVCFFKQGNARKYYVKKKSAAMKELKTIESQSVAMKSAEKKTKQVKIWEWIAAPSLWFLKLLAKHVMLANNSF